MPLTLYSLRSEIDVNDATRYRITKFVDGEVESSYHTSRDACECPAGLRPTCRHRQMLPQMLNANIANTHWFYEFDRGAVVDFEGTPRSRYEFDEDNCIGHVASAQDAKVCGRCGVHIDSLRPPEPTLDDITDAVHQTIINHPWRRL